MRRLRVGLLDAGGLMSLVSAMADDLDDLFQGIRRDLGAFRESLWIIKRFAFPPTPEPPPKPSTDCQHPIEARQDYGPYDTDTLCSLCGWVRCDSDFEWREGLSGDT